MASISKSTKEKLNALNSKVEELSPEAEKEAPFMATIHNGILNIAELFDLNDMVKFKKYLEKYPIHIIEIINDLCETCNWRALFKLAVDFNDMVLKENIYYENIKNIKEKFMRNLKLYESLNINKKYIKRDFSYIKFNDALEYLSKLKEELISKYAYKYDKNRIIKGLTKEYFESEMEKGNFEIVVIKLCVRLEAILRSMYNSDLPLFELVTKYCNTFNIYDDEEYNYDPYTPKILKQLVLKRNNIVHSENNGVDLGIKDLNNCIKHICDMK